MKVVYSYGSALGVGGLANTVDNELRALADHGMLARALCGFARAPALPAGCVRAFGLPDRVLRKLAPYDGSRWLLHLQNVLYDRWASRHVEAGDLFLVWSTYGLRSLRRARALGITTGVIRGSTHPLHAERVDSEEHARWGVPYRSPRVRLQRKLDELAAADVVLVPTVGVVPTYTAYGAAPARVVAAGGRGVDVRRFVPGRAAAGRPFRVLFVGSVNLCKGVPYLLQAWRQLGWRDAELCLVGQVDAAIRSLLQREKLPGLHVAGHRRDPLPAYQQADVFVLPTLDDACVKVTYEAMACGLPVVTTPEAWSPVRDGSEGFIVPARDPGAIAERLDRLRRDDGLRRELGRAARARAESLTWERHGELFVECLRGLI